MQHRLKTAASASNLSVCVDLCCHLQANTHHCCLVTGGCAWWGSTSPQERCPGSHTCTSNRRRPSSRRTWWTPHHPLLPRWWQGRWGMGSSCPQPPASCLAWRCSGGASEAPDNVRNMPITVTYTQTNNKMATCMYKAFLSVYLFKGCCRGHFCSIQGSQQKHGPWGRIHPKSWRREFIKIKMRWNIRRPYLLSSTHHVICWFISSTVKEKHLIFQH